MSTASEIQSRFEKYLATAAHYVHNGTRDGLDRQLAEIAIDVIAELRRVGPLWDRYPPDFQNPHYFEMLDAEKIADAILREMRHRPPANGEGSR